MISLVVAFYIFVVMGAIIGSMRGWGKEVLVSFSVVLALGFIAVFEDLFPYTNDLFQDGSLNQFWVRTGILLCMVFFGYQSPKLSRFARYNEKRDRVQDFILGLLFGALNGYLIFGTLWYFMDEAGYPFSPAISSPETLPSYVDQANRLLNSFAPAVLSGYWIYVAVVVSFIFVLVVLI
jgi:hypothetical protein